MTKLHTPRSQKALAVLMRRHPLATLVSVVILIAAIIYLAWWMGWRASHVTSNDARLDGEMIKVASRVSGWLTQLPVIEGQTIKKGQILAVLDKRDAQLRLNDLQARIAADTAKIQQYETQQHTTRGSNQAEVADASAQLTAAGAAVAQAEHQEQLAKIDFDRIDKLLKTGVVSRQQWDTSHNHLIQLRDALDHARAKRTAASAALKKAQAEGGQVDVLTQQINVVREQRKSLMAQADQVRQELADRTLNSPVTGVVDKTLVNQGDFVQPGQWLMMIHDPTKIWVEANVKETAITELRPGDPVDIQVDAYPDLKVTGKVLHVGNATTSMFALLPSPNPSGSFTKITQRVPVRIIIDNPDPRLKPGLMVEVAIDVSH